MLNVQQENFVAEFVANGGNGTQAYQAVYNSDKATARANASRLLRKPEVQTRLKEIQAEVTNPKILTAQELQERLSAVARREVSETVLTPHGKLIEKPVSIRDSLVAMQTLARISGLYVNKQEIELSAVMPVVIHDDF